MRSGSSEDPRPGFRYSRYHNTGETTSQGEDNMHVSEQLKELCEQMGIPMPPPDGVLGKEV